MAPAPNMAFFTYADRPGIIGTVGSILGEERINIGSMEVGRKAAGGEALMGLTVDSPLSPELLDRLARETEAQTARFIVLPRPAH